MKLHIGNLATNTRKEDLQKVFGSYGEITRINVVKDKETGEPRGFAFIEFDTTEAGQGAIAGLHDTELLGNEITVREARTKKTS
jgi:RNA recognition motif-containing protein